uniref:Ester hydrolase c11orf54-like protein n=1 Tax=Triatoma infestans TaxID=30076 RepID=A0A171AA04_TRIIF
MSAINSQHPTTSVKLDCPKLEDVANALQKGLPQYFAETEVAVVDCPDLREEPFNLAAKGLGGKTVVIDIGGPGFLFPLHDETKIYDMKKDIANTVGMKSCFIIGAGAGPWPYIGKNCEMMANILINDSTSSIVQKTYIAKVNDKTEDIEVELLPNSEMRFSLLANLFACEGTSSKVLKVFCKKRKQDENFITSISTTLEKAFPNKTLGLGGTFLLKEGKARQHCMPEFSKVPIRSNDDLNNWLKFYEMSAPLVAVGTLLSKDIPDLHVRVQHFHSFSNHGEGGHYHYDTTPETVEYLGYFNLGQTLCRIDQPEKKQYFDKN